MKSEIHLSQEVAESLNKKQAVVALESTLITHGLPYPANVETALAMEAAVREAGAIPATIAILKGQITVGLSVAEIERLATMPAGSVRKCSRRDFAIAVGLGQDAATTVAGTMIVAHQVAIHVFATGGIGGVHRGQPFDVSADLMELGRTPVAVVCSGAKSILDLPLTLEVLETQGVPIIGLGTDTLPAFYSRSSSLPIDTCVDSPRQIALIIDAAHRLDMHHGILVTVPVPAGQELPTETAEIAIQQATNEASSQGIHGKEVTPFVLQRVAELTEGESRRANVALLVNNALVGGQIARELQAIQS
jgi:pseudouridylate synthase